MALGRDKGGWYPNTPWQFVIRWMQEEDDERESLSCPGAGTTSERYGDEDKPSFFALLKVRTFRVSITRRITAATVRIVSKVPEFVGLQTIMRMRGVERGR